MNWLSPEGLRELEYAATLQKAVEGQYEIEELQTGKLEDRGKFKLNKRKFSGGTNKRDTVNALLMAIDVEQNGAIVDRSGTSIVQGQETFGDKRLRMAAEALLAPAGASELAGVGLRTGDLANLSGEERLLRAIDRIRELDNGYNPVTGSLYRGIGLDGGHKMAHSNYKGQSANRDNMMFESKYENRTKGNREGAAMVQAMYNSLFKRLKKEKVSPETMNGLWKVGDGYGVVVAPEM